MKSFVLPIAFALAVATATVFGTGAIVTNPNDGVPANPAQSGTLYPVATNGTQAAGYVVTNYFPYVFNATPALILTTIAGNIVTNTYVSTTNFIVTSQNTNYPVNWTAYAGYQRIQVGTSVAGGTNITFPVPYIVAPTVVVSGLNTNIVTLGTVSATGFTINSAVTNGVTVSWMSFGTAANVGPNIVNY